MAPVTTAKRAWPAGLARAVLASVVLSVAAWVLLGLLAHTLLAAPGVGPGAGAQPPRAHAAHVLVLEREHDGDRL